MCWEYGVELYHSANVVKNIENGKDIKFAVILKCFISIMYDIIKKTKFDINVDFCKEITKGIRYRTMNINV